MIVLFVLLAGVVGQLLYFSMVLGNNVGPDLHKHPLICFGDESLKNGGVVQSL